MSVMTPQITENSYVLLAALDDSHKWPMMGSEFHGMTL